MRTEHDKLVEDCKRAILALKSNHEEDLANAVIAIAVERCAAVADAEVRKYEAQNELARCLVADDIRKTIRALLSPNDRREV